MHVNAKPQRSEEGIGLLEAGVTGSCELLNVGSEEPNSGFYRSSKLMAAEASLHSPISGFLRNLHTGFHSSWTSVHSYQSAITTQNFPAALFLHSS